MILAKDKNGIIKIQRNVMDIASDYDGTFHYKDIVFALKSMGARIIDNTSNVYLGRVRPKTIGVNQIRNCLNRNSFKKSDFPKGYCYKGHLIKLGNGWYTWVK